MGRHSRGGAQPTPPAPDPTPPATQRPRSVEDTGVWDRSTYRVVDVGLPPGTPGGVTFPLGGRPDRSAPPAGGDRYGATRADLAGPPSRYGAADSATSVQRPPEPARRIPAPPPPEPASRTAAPPPPEPARRTAAPPPPVTSRTPPPGYGHPARAADPAPDRYGGPRSDSSAAPRPPGAEDTGTGLRRPGMSDSAAGLRPLGMSDGAAGLRPLGMSDSAAGLRPLGMSDSAAGLRRPGMSDSAAGLRPLGLGDTGGLRPVGPADSGMGLRRPGVSDSGAGLHPLDSGGRLPGGVPDSAAGPQPLGSAPVRGRRRARDDADGPYGATRADLVRDTDGATALAPEPLREPDEVTDTGARRTRSTFRVAEEPEELDDEPSLLLQWAVFVAQTLTGAAVGLGVWLGFYRLWSTWPFYAAPAVGVAMIVMLVVARMLRRRHGHDLDLLTAIVTIGIGTVLTVLPATFTLQNLA